MTRRNRDPVPRMARRALLGIGSNSGNRWSHLRGAVEGLPDVVEVSPVYETAPVGGPDQDPYLNCVVRLETDLSADRLAFVVRDEGAHPLLRITCDIGNEASLGLLPAEQYAELAPLLGSVHVKDRSVGGSTVALGMGRVTSQTEMATVWPALTRSRSGAVPSGRSRASRTAPDWSGRPSRYVGSITVVRSSGNSTGRPVRP